jgi:cathepsin D
VTFGSGTLMGYFARDTFQFGNVLVYNQSFGVVIEEELFDDSFDAIFGLAYPSMCDTSLGLPLFDNMMAQKVLENNVFAFFMSMNDEEPSELVLGYIDQNRFSGSLVWHDVINKYFFSLRLTDVLFNG